MSHKGKIGKIDKIDKIVKIGNPKLMWIFCSSLGNELSFNQGETV